MLSLAVLAQAAFGYRIVPAGMLPLLPTHVFHSYQKTFVPFTGCVLDCKQCVNSKPVPDTTLLF
jgi:pyruvate-formate lyase-activating enzyme